MFHVVGGLGMGIGGGGGGDEAGVVSKLKRPSGALGLGGLPRRFGVAGIGGSRPPAVRETKLISGVRPSPGCARARACNEGATEGAGPGLGAAGSFHHTTGRGAMTFSGEFSGEVPLELRLLPQVQRARVPEPSSTMAPQTLRARIGLPQRRHTHMQCAASKPHWRPVPWYGA